MPSIIGVAGAVPGHRIYQHQARGFARALFQTADFDVEQLLSVFANSTVRERYVCADRWYETEAGFANAAASIASRGPSWPNGRWSRLEPCSTAWT